MTILNIMTMSEMREMMLKEKQEFEIRYQSDKAYQRLSDRASELSLSVGEYVQDLILKYQR